MIILKILRTVAILVLSVLFCSAAEKNNAGKDVSLPASAPASETGLIGYWPLDGAGTNVVEDRSGSGYDADVGNALWTAGKSGGALEFNGKDEYVRIPFPKSLSSFTIQAWARPADVPASPADYAIFGRAGWHNCIGYNAKKQFYHTVCTADKNTVTVSTPAAYEPGEWHLVTGVIDRGTGKVLLYVDGVVQGSAGLTGELYPYGDVWNIGCANQYSIQYPAWFKGRIDEVKLYERALTATEIAAYHAATKRGLAVESPSFGKPLSLGTRKPLSEIPPPITDKLIAKLKGQRPAEASVITRADGVPSLMVNGVAQPLIGCDMFNLRLHHTPLLRSGVNITIPIYNLSPFWTGKNQYDPSGIDEKLLWRPLQTNPDAKLILWLMVDVYPGWYAEHPDELMRNEKGEFLIVAPYFLRYDQRWDLTKGERPVPSFWSDAFRDEASAMLREFVRTVEKTAPGNALIGYMIMGGQDGQLYHWHCPNDRLSSKPELWGDFSPTAMKAWRTWLAAKYGDVKTLTNEWRMNVASFDAAPPPKAERLAASAWLHDPRADRQAMDWKRFHTESRYRLIEHFAKIVKESASRPVVVGCTGGDSGCRRDLTTVAEFVRSPYLDFFLHQVTYSQRLPPSVGGINAWLSTYPLHGKIFVADWDFSTWLQPLPIWQGGFNPGSSAGAELHGQAKNIEMLRSMWRREYAQLWTAVGGVAYNPFSEEAIYDDDAIVAEMKFLREATIEARPPSPRKPLAEVAFIYDEKAVDWCRAGLAQLHSQWLRIQQNEILASGVPCNVYYAEDLRDGLVPPAKVYVFINQIEIDGKMASAIAGLKRDNAFLVFLRYTGYAHVLDARTNLAKAIGIEIARLEDAATSSAAVDAKHALVNWDGGKAKSAVVLPVRWKVFGPFAKRDPPPDMGAFTTIPSSLAAGAKTAAAAESVASGGYLDLQAVFGGALEAERWAVVMAEIESPHDETVTFSAGADWWMDWWVNGKRVFDTLMLGNAMPISRQNHQFSVPLKAGKNLVAVRVVSGSGGFLLAVGGPGDTEKLDPMNEGLVTDKNYNPTVVDPKATVLANYADRPAPAFAIRDHGAWKSVFIASPFLTRNMLNVIARHAGAWCVTRPGTVVAVGENFLMLHPLKSGEISVRLKEPATLVPWGSYPAGAPAGVPARQDHALTLTAGETYLYRIGQ